MLLLKNKPLILLGAIGRKFFSHSLFSVILQNSTNFPNASYNEKLKMKDSISFILHFSFYSIHFTLNYFRWLKCYIPNGLRISTPKIKIPITYHCSLTNYTKLKFLLDKKSNLWYNKLTLKIEEKGRKKWRRRWEKPVYF